MKAFLNKKSLLFPILLLGFLMIGANKKSDKVDNTLGAIVMRQITDSLYAQETEVNNEMYRAFLDALKMKGNIEKYNLYNIDSTKWRIYNEPYATYYHRHPAYRGYPVVNVNYAGATAFCDWLTEWYNAYPKRKFKKVKVRLPTEQEWIYAAKGGLDSVAFSWKGASLKNSKGMYMCNFRHFEEACIKRDRKTGEIKMDYSIYKVVKEPTYDVYDVTASVYSYWPNGYGLYDMCGNVAEMLLEKGKTKGGSWASSGYYMRIDSEDEYQGFTEPSPMIGFRVFMDVIEK